MRRHIAAALCCATALSCGYFNTMYNANQRFRAAERAAARGDSAAAVQAWTDAIAKAAASYRGHPDGRWADDALFLIGRARFALGETEAAEAAFLTLLEMPLEPGARAAALAWLGAAQVRLGAADDGLARLDSALAGPLDEDAAGFARLWRARAAFELGRPDAWAELDAAATTNASPWRAAALDGIAMRRAARLAEDGDTAGAIAEAIRLAGTAVAGEDATRLRLFAARLELARITEPGGLDRVRTMLGPVDGDAEAADLLRPVALVRHMAGQGAERPLAYFAAAELARDALAARPLARHLFLAFADAEPDAVWAPKALLAAAALADTPAEHGALVARIGKHRHNVYVAATNGNADPAVFMAAERELAESLAALRDAARGVLAARDPLFATDAVRDSSRSDTLHTRAHAPTMPERSQQ